MSVELQVQLTATVCLGDIVKASTEALSALLAVDSLPVLEAFRWERGEEQGPLDPDTKLEPGADILLRFSNSAKRGVDLSVVCLPAAEGADEEGGCWAMVEVVSRVPLYFAVAAAVAISLANLCKSPIIDEVGFWSTIRRTDAGRLTRAIPMRATGRDLETAASEYYSLLPRGRK